MTSSTMSDINQSESEQPIWEHLKQAIAASSGFKRWQEEQVGDRPLESQDLDERVCSYLRETLETLAY